MTSFANQRLTCVILLITVVSSLNIYSQKIENLVFEGAGIRGIAYAGVLQKLEEKGIIKNISQVGGTSAGGITSLMVSLGYDSKEIYNLISSTKFKKFNDGSFFFIGGFRRLNKKFGWYRTKEIDKWIGEIIANKTNNPNITFKELKNGKFKDLYLTGTCLNKQNLIIFSANTYPNMQVRDAVRISMSVPLYFEAGFIDREGKVYKNLKGSKNLDIVVDGGIIGNFPIHLFDSVKIDSNNLKKTIPNMNTLGVRIDSDAQIKEDSLSKKLVPIKINNGRDYLNAFYTLIIENLNRNMLTDKDWERTISISSVGIGPRIKKLSAFQKDQLVKSGANFTEKYLSKIAP